MWSWWIPVAWAFGPSEVPPFDPARRVVLIPPDLDVRTSAVTSTVSATTHPAYAVIVARVIDGTVAPGLESETEDAIETVWAEWSRDPRFDPAESNLALLGLDDREVRLRAGTRWDAELGLHDEALLPFVDDHFLPRAAAGDLDGGLAGMIAALDAHIDARLARKARLALAGRVGAGAVGVGTPLAALLVLRTRATRARDRFRAAVAARRAALERAEARWAELGLSVELRDRVVALKLRGARTQAVVSEVTAKLDHLRVGLDGLQRRLREVESEVRGGAWSVAGWDAGVEALAAPFDHDTGAGTGLFAPERRTVRVDPAAVDAELESVWVEASAGWTLVVDAVAASMRSARDDLSLTDLDRARGALDAAGLHRGWCADHPLATDPEGAWEALEALRRADPVAYLESLREAVGRDDAIEQRVDELVRAVDAARAVRAAALAIDVGAHEASAREAGDPDPRGAELEAAEWQQELDAALTPSEDLAGSAARAVSAARDAAAAWEQLRSVRAELVAAVGGAAGAVEEALRAGRALDDRIASARDALTTLLAEHAAPSVQDVSRELSEAKADRREAVHALEEAQAALAAGRHLRAARAAARAARERDEALADLSELATAMRAARDRRARAEALEASLDGVRSRVAAVADAGELAEGDRLRAAATQGAGPVDWGARAETLAAAVAAWEAARARAEARERARQQAIAAARAAERARAASTRSSGSAYRSSSSWSSSRSSGSSSSASRSAGRSFSSSGRSAGRKF